jgi:hypothetical protein
VEVRILPCAPPARLSSRAAPTACSSFRPSALVAQWTERRASISGPCGFESCRGLHHFTSMRPRSSMDQSGGVRSLRLRVRIAPWTPNRQCHFEKRRVGRAARHRGANAARPSGRAGSTPALSTNRLARLFFDDHDAITHGSLRLVARIAAFQAAEDGSKPSGSTNRSPFVQRQDAAL